MRAAISLLILSALGCHAATLDGASLSDALAGSAASYLGKAHFEVLLPSAQDPVEYDVLLQSSTAEADSLSPCSYLLRWEAQAPSGPITGFSAYFDGNLYRYRSGKLQEYHALSGVEPFAPGGDITSGVQSSTQFADLLPQFLAARVRSIVTDSACVYTVHPDTVVDGRRAVAIDGTKYNNGYESQLFLYAFDPVSFEPVYTDVTTSPGSISEQVVTVAYSPADGAERVEPLSEEALIALWPEEFEKYRQSTFRVESLVGSYLPDFSCQRLTGTTRFTHRHGDALERPALIVAIDPAVATAASTIEQVRHAAAMIDVDVIWAFSTNHGGDIADLLGEERVGETALPSASTLLRNCGVTLFPTIILAGADGKVADVMVGHNQDAASVVIQKASIAFNR